jgi:hypothetical protein
MKIFLATLPVFAVLWFFMRLLKELWEKDKLPGWFSPIGGIIAWATVASAVGMMWGVVEVLVRLFTEPSWGTAFEFIGIGFAISMGGKLLADNPEILDYARVKPLIVESLLFRKYDLRREDIFVELDKHNVKKVYQETTGKAFPKEMEKKMKPIPHMDPEEALKELERVRAMPLRSVHLEDQLGQLKAGEVTDISDSFKLNAMKHKTHDFYELASEMKIAPQAKLLSFKIIFPLVTAQTTFDADRIYRLKQGIYDLFQALRSEVWLKPYAEYFSNLKVVCYRTDTDTFGLPTEQPFFSVEIALSELRQREGKLFVATELDKIATVTFSL